MHQRPLGLERSEDQAEKVMETEKELYKKGKSRGELQIGMDLLWGSVADGKRSGVSSPI
jgi:hypothetical protein